MPTSPTFPASSDDLQIAGINVQVHDRLHYLEALAHIVANQFPNYAAAESLRQQLGQAVGYFPQALSPAQRRSVNFDALPNLVGWFHQKRLEQMLHREWLVGETNEFRAHEPVLARIEAFSRATRMHLVGAGVCRLAAYLVQTQAESELVCSDLSYLALYFGKMLLQGEHDQLFAGFTKPRRHYTVSPDQTLLAHDLPTHYEVADLNTARLHFEVRNICDTTAISSDTQLVCAMYLIDAATNCTPMLVRMCQQMQVGQDLVLITSINENRDPAAILQILATCGLQTQHLELAQLPYSFTRHDATYAQLRSQTLIVQAKKTESSKLSNFAIAPTATFEAISTQRVHAPFPGQRHLPAPIFHSQGESLRQAMRAGNYGDFLQIANKELGEATTNELVTWLCTRSFLQIGLR